MVRDFSSEIEEAKIEIELKWRRAYHKDKDAQPPTEFFVSRWATGFIVIDQAALMKMSKSKQNKIYKIGG